MRDHTPKSNTQTRAMKPSRSRVSGSPPKRRALVVAARSVLWDRIRGCLGPRREKRSTLRRRLAAFLRSNTAGRLAAILRSAALAGAVAAALAAPSPLQSQEIQLDPIELADVARGRGGFVVRGEGEPASGAGWSVADGGDVNGDGIPDLLISGGHCGPYIDCTMAPTYVVFGKADSSPVDLGDIKEGRGGFAIRGAAAGGVGYSVSGVGDVNGDGLAEVLLGARWGSPEGRSDAGESYVVFGKADGTAVELSDIQAGRGGFAIRGSAAYDRAGSSVSAAGDVDGDGLSDLVVGAFLASPGGRRDAGESYVIFGKADGALVELSEIQEGRGGFAIRGSAAYDRAGSSVSAAGDVDGDGLADLLIGAPYADPTARRSAGESYVVFGKADGLPVELSDVQEGRGGFSIRGSAAYDEAGSSVSGVGDVNGDGFADVLVGATRASPEGRSQAGESHVVFGKADGAVVELSDVRAGLGGFAIRGAAPGDNSGGKVAGAGDVNGDGIPDLIIGGVFCSPHTYRCSSAPVYVVFGKADGAAVELSEVQAGFGGFAIRGVLARYPSGHSVSGAGDVDGDGLADVLVGAPGAGAGRAGECYVILGKGDGAPVEVSEVQEGRGGFAIRGVKERNLQSQMTVAGAGDVNGDGLLDVLIGVPGAGESYVVFGKGDGAVVEFSEIGAGRGGFGIRGAAPGSVSGATDVNGDGLADLLVGAWSASPESRAGAGESYVIFGKADGAPVEISEIQAGRGGFAVRGSAAGDGSGRSVAGTGDVNGDGFADLLVGSYASPEGRDHAGESYVVFGKPDGASVELSEIQAGRGGFAIRGAAAEDFAGVSVSGAGDVNVDGLADLLIGAPFADPRGMDSAGESYVVFGKGDGATVEISQIQAGGGGFAIRGAAPRDRSGSSVAGAGDVNGDGLPDLLVGSPWGTLDGQGDVQGGKIYVVFGKTDGASVELSEIQEGRGGFAIRGAEGMSRLGSRGTVSGAGDFNGDGHADLLIGAPRSSPPEGWRGAGESYVIFGKADGVAVDLSEVQAGLGGFALRGAALDDRSGSSVAGAGDVNGDGLADVLVASRFGEARYPGYSGAAYVVFGRGRDWGSEQLFHRGDPDASGTTDISDAVTIFGFLFLGSPAVLTCLESADTNNDGAIDITDGIAVLQFLFVDGPEPPAPGPPPNPCGVNPDHAGAEGDLGCDRYDPCSDG